jgi:heat shock protein HtpX
MEEKKFDLSQLYIIDFAKNLFRKKNALAVVYLAINVLIITLMMQMFEPNIWLCLLYGILIYGVTATIALSPLGEWYFRRTNGCKKIDDPNILNRLEPLFLEVKERAKNAQTDFIIDDNIQLYISDDDSINAFAMGRRTVCVTRGLLQLNDEQIKGVLGHEFGHLASHDTELTLLITVGNFIITAIVTVIRVILAIYNVIISIIAGILGDEGAIVGLLQAVASFMTTLCINGLMWIWTQLGILLVMKSSRNAEYEADAFSCNLGYTNGMLSFFRVLEHLEGGSGKKERNNIFAALASSHPDTSKRIARIEERAPLALED